MRIRIFLKHVIHQNNGKHHLFWKKNYGCINFLAAVFKIVNLCFIVRERHAEQGNGDGNIFCRRPFNPALNFIKDTRYEA